jgi:threonylcarbamoyladenosine tRNA methylthiotransferase MtaB
MVNISFQTFGCKLNFSETSSIISSLNTKKFNVVEDVKDADFHIIHSCTVTDHAEKKCRQAIRHIAKTNPQIKIVIIGCYSQLRPSELELFDNVAFVCGNESKFNLGNLIEQYIDNKTLTAKGKIQPDDYKDFAYHSSVSHELRTRTFLKIQDGCDYFCTYCAVPYARGRSRSDSINDVINLATKAVDGGSKEVVITGVNLGDFGRKNGESFYDLLSQMIDIKGLERIRISSIEPNLLSNEIIKLAAVSTKIMPHFHIPLQAGTDKILKLMKRRYDTSFFTDKLDEILEYIPDACIAVDLITGFPGEDNHDFEDTLKFIESSKISYLHIFSYSDRKEAAASKFPDKNADAEIIRRSKILHDLSKNKHIIFNSRFSGQTRKVLFEQQNSDGKWTGWTDNYIHVEYNSTDDLHNRILAVKLP